MPARLFHKLTNADPRKQALNNLRTRSEEFPLHINIPPLQTVVVEQKEQPLMSTIVEDEKEEKEEKEESNVPLLLGIPKDTPLYRHIKAFGGGLDDITFSRMHELNKSIKDPDAKMRALRVLLVGAINTRTKPRGCPFAVHFDAHAAVGKMNHKQSTRIYKLDGTIDMDRWNGLKKNMSTVNGTRILTKVKFYEFLRKCRDAETDSNCFTKFFGKKASDGEWLLYWTLFGEKDAQGNEFVKEADLWEFFNDSQKSIDKLKAKIAAEHVAAPTPVMSSQRLN